jgi:tetratricopeptide (TPR) repeat protein
MRYMEIQREKFLTLMAIAFEMREYRFASEALDIWLEKYPGDLQANMMKAVNLHTIGEFQEAKEKLRSLISVDPAFFEAYLAIADIYAEDDNIWAYLFAISGQQFANHKILAWGKAVHSFLTKVKNEQWKACEENLPRLLKHSGRNALVDLVHLLYVYKTQDPETTLTLASIYRERWPQCNQIQLMQSDCKMRTGELVEAFEGLSHCAQVDMAGQTARWAWDEGNPYQSMWPTISTIDLTIQMPAAISERFGWNLLTEGDEPNQEGRQQRAKKIVYSEPDVDQQKEIDEVRSVFEKLAKVLNAKSNREVDERFPYYVVMSSFSRLSKKYGSNSAKVLAAQMQRICDTVAQQHNIGALLFMPDDANSMNDLGMDTLKRLDPWSLKLALHDLDENLAQKGGMIGWLLIVGGDDIIPFHMLPNPTDDVDENILSDNPYGSSNANYFVPEWPVGRLPGEKGNDCGLLLAQLRRIIKDHQEAQKKEKLASKAFTAPFTMLMDFFRLIFRTDRYQTKEVSVGYTAAIWRRASMAVYRPIGAANMMAVSPPLSVSSVDMTALMGAKLAYYNLHGLVDSGEWFGQKDYITSDNGSDFPVALTPSTFSMAPQFQQFIFSEACYGAYTIDKTSEDALSLKFMSFDAKAFVGSTGIAYGSIQPPLIGADLLAKNYWDNLVAGMTTGECLLRAKKQLAVEMQNRQNYLDGEDQKTLLTFVLFGDPLARYDGSLSADSKIFMGRSKENFDTMVLTEVEAKPGGYEAKIDESSLQEIRDALAAYLPGLKEAGCSIREQYILGEESLAAKLSFNPPERLSRSSNGNVVLSFEQKYPAYKGNHKIFTKVTVDDLGKMLKISVSR